MSSDSGCVETIEEHARERVRTYVYVCMRARVTCTYVFVPVGQYGKKFFLAVQFWQYTTYRDGGGLVDHDDVLVHVYHRDRLRGDRHLVSATHQSQPA